MESEKIMLELEKEFPKCGEISYKLGDYYFNKEIWMAAQAHYEKARVFLPEDKRVEAKINEVKEKCPILIRNMQEYKSNRAGATRALQQEGKKRNAC